MTSVVALVIATAAVLGADEVSAKDQLKMWGEEHVGTWAGPDKLDADLPGFGKKGDTLDGEVTWTEHDGVYRGAWKGTVNGKVIDSGIAVVGWDASKKAIKVEWVTRNGASASNLIKRKGKRWQNNFILISPDGTKSTNKGSTLIKGNKMVTTQTKRKRGKETLPDHEVTWMKK